ncbi:MAG: C39 family peptidase [Erysipelotrichaceae bacterium]
MKHKLIYIICIAFVVLAVLTGFSASQNRKHREELALKAEKSVEVLFQDKKQTTPKLDLKQKNIELAQKKVDQVQDKKKATSLNKKLSLLSQYIKYQDKINAYFVEGICQSDINQDQLAKDEVSLRKLPVPYVKLLEPQLNKVKAQVQAMNDAIASTKALFNDEAMNNVKDDANSDSYQAALDKVNALPQKNLVETYTPVLEKVNQFLLEKEKIARQRIEAQRQAALAQALAEAKAAKEQAEKDAQRNALIQASNVKIQGIPYYNQNSEGLPNGCECTSLMMALHYKGYAKDLNLHQFVDACPRSDNPHLGFIYPMDSYAPYKVVHWIAPDALSKFGSNYGTVVDISDCSTDALKAEIDQGNPVVFYATYGFRDAKGWDGEVPTNLHVMLLIGYNPVSNSYIVSDPVLGELVVSAQRFEAIFAYNRFAISVR